MVNWTNKSSWICWNNCRSWCCWCTWCHCSWINCDGWIWMCWICWKPNTIVVVITYQIVYYCNMINNNNNQSRNDQNSQSKSTDKYQIQYHQYHQNQSTNNNWWNWNWIDCNEHCNWQITPTNYTNLHSHINCHKFQWKYKYYQWIVTKRTIHICNQILQKNQYETDQLLNWQTLFHINKYSNTNTNNIHWEPIVVK